MTLTERVGIILVNSPPLCTVSGPRSNNSCHSLIECSCHRAEEHLGVLGAKESIEWLQEKMSV